MPWEWQEFEGDQHRKFFIPDIETMRAMVHHGKLDLNSRVVDQDTGREVLVGDVLNPARPPRPPTPYVEVIEDVPKEPTPKAMPPAPPPTPLRAEQPKRRWERMLQFRVLVPSLAAIIGLLLLSTWGVISLAKRMEIGRATQAFKEGRFYEAQKRCNEIAKKYEPDDLATWGKMMAAFCSIKAEVASVSPNYPQIIRLCNGFIEHHAVPGASGPGAEVSEEYSASKLVEDAKEILAKAHLDYVDLRYRDAKQREDVESLKRLHEFLATLASSMPETARKRTKELMLQIKTDEDRIRFEKEYRESKESFLAAVEKCLQDGNFDAIRQQYRDLVGKHYFLESDPEIRVAMAEIGKKEQELAALAQVTAPSPAPAQDSVTIPSVRIIQRVYEEGMPEVEGSLFCAVKGQCVAIDAKTGEFLWERPFGLGSDSFPVRLADGGGEGVLLYSREGGRMDVIEGRTGKVRWSYQAERELSGLPCVYGDRVYVGVRGTGVRVLNVSDGSPVGMFRVGGEIQLSPVLEPEEGALYVLNENGCLYIFDLETGTCKDIVQLNYPPFSIFCVPLVTRFHIFLFESIEFGSTQIRVLYRNSPDSHWQMLDWNEVIPERISSPPIIVAGRLYFVTDSGRLYAYGTNTEESKQDRPLFPLTTAGYPTRLPYGYTLRSVKGSPFTREGISEESELMLVSAGMLVFRLDPLHHTLKEIWRGGVDVGAPVPLSAEDMDNLMGRGDTNSPPGNAACDSIAALGAPQFKNSVAYLSTVSRSCDGIDVTAVDCAKNRKLWCVRIGAGIIGRPLVNRASGCAYVRAVDGAVYSVPYENMAGSADIKGGPLLPGGKAPATDVGFAMQLCAIRGKMNLYVGGAENSLYAFDPATGQPCQGWEQPFVTRGAPGPITHLKDGRLIFGTDQGFIYLVSAERAEALCEEYAAEHKYSFGTEVVPYDRYFLAGDDGGILHKLEIKTESEKDYIAPAAKFEAGFPIESAPIVVGDDAFIADAGGAIYEIDLRTMQKQRDWSGDQRIGGGVNSGLGYSEAYQLLIFGCADARLYGFSVKSGKIAWKYPAEDGRQPGIGAMAGRALIRGDVTYFGSTSGWVHAIKTKTGKLLWKRCVGAKVSGELAACADGILVPCADGRLCKLPFDFTPESVKGNSNE